MCVGVIFIMYNNLYCPLDCDLIKVPTHLYKSGLTPKPGPVGGSDKEVNPPLGSDANLRFWPLLLKITTNNSVEDQSEIIIGLD